MGVFNHFPYTNIHELNLDWIIEKVKEALDEIADLETLRENFADLEAYVQNYFDNLDVSQEISDKIDKMVADGTMAQIINGIIDTKLAKNQDMHINRIGRLLDRFSLENRNRVLYGQSCCYKDGMYYTSGAETGNAIQHITVWNSNGEFVNTASYTQFYHANDITACGAYLAIATGKSNDLSIGIIDRTTLTEANIITVPSTFGIYTVYAIGSDDEFLYAVGAKADGTRAIIKIGDFINAPTFELMCTVPVISSTVTQGCCYYDGYMYLVYNKSNIIYKIDITTGNIDTAFMIPDGDGFNPCGESETVFTKDDKMYLFSPTGVPENLLSLTDFSQFSQIFETDILSVLESDNRGNYRPDYQYALTVNENASYEFNPFLTYTTIEEACSIADYVNNVNEISISNCSRGILWVSNNHLFVNSSSSSNTLSNIRVTNSNVWMHNLIAEIVYASSGSKLVMNTCDLNKSLSVIRSEVELDRCYIRLTGEYMERGKLRITSPLDTTLDASFNNQTSNTLGNTFSFKGAYSDNVLKLAKNCNYLLVSPFRNSDMVNVIYSNANIISATPITTSISNSLFTSVEYDNYTVRLINSNGTFMPSQIFVETV